MAENKTCNECRYAVLIGGDYDSAFGGGYTPEIVEECQHPSVNADDMDSAIERGIAGKCKFFVARADDGREQKISL